MKVSCSNLLHVHHVLQDLQSPPVNHDEHEPMAVQSPPFCPSRPTMVFGEFLTGANIEISQRSMLPPDPPPLPEPLPKISEHSYARKVPQGILDRDQKIQSLQLQVKSLLSARKRDKIKLQTARNKIRDFEKGQFSHKLKVATVHELLNGSFSSTVINNIINRSRNPKGKLK